MSMLFKKIKQEAPLIMGITNVTPDSFSDGGDYNAPQMAIDHGLSMLEQGAHILDIGGESTRPNAETVSVEEEICRVVPVIEGLKSKAEFISIDTRNAQTMQAAITAGANIINDVSALSYDPQSVDVAAQSRVPVCLMHMVGTPKTMQNNPTYEDIIDDLKSYFEGRITFCVKNGVKEENIILDPGIGFGKTLHHNLVLLKNLAEFKCFARPILLGVSRKSFIQMIDGQQDPKKRLGGSLAAALHGAFDGGAEIIRVHDVAETRQALNVYQSIQSA
jgi:dihydropteroate synthase